MLNKSTHDIAASFSRRGVLAATAGLMMGLASLTGAKAADDTIKVGVLHSLSGTMAISETHAEGHHPLPHRRAEQEGRRQRQEARSRRGRSCLELAAVR
ncbi:hypothetical protein ACVWXN_007466 [Bradyrhizobium sp. i1.4.4]